MSKDTIEAVVRLLAQGASPDFVDEQKDKCAPLHGMCWDSAVRRRDRSECVGQWRGARFPPQISYVCPCERSFFFIMCVS